MGEGVRVTGYDCVTCGAHHDELPNCFLIPLPLPVFQVPEEQRGHRVQGNPELCVLDNEHYFILGNVDVKVRNSDDFIRWTVWASLSQTNAARAAELWNAPGREKEPPYFGWLCNVLPGYDSTLHLKTHVHTQEVGVRPVIEVDPQHLLGREQRDGITAARRDELIHAAVAMFAPQGVPVPTVKPWWKFW